jgi:Arc-like DNA binding dprotein
MAKRSKTAKADIKIRLTEALRSKIERSARSSGISMNADMIERLDRSFKSEDEFGGPQWRQIGHMMVAAFILAGQREAESKQLTTPWIVDAECYLSAVLGVIDGLTIAAPRRVLDSKYVDLIMASMKGRLATTLVNRASKEGKS